MTIAAARAVALAIAVGTLSILAIGCRGKAVESPVCGRDGKVYPSERAAQAAGVELDVTGGCRDQVPGWAPCGAHYCNAETSYCEIYLSDVREIPTDHFCRKLPESCLRIETSARTCDCLPAETPCRSFCGPLPAGGTASFHLTCQGRSPPKP